MEVCLPCNKSAGEYISRNSGFSDDPLNQTHCNSRNPPVDDLKTSSPQHLKIKDDEVSSGCYVDSDKNCEVSLKKGNGSIELDKSESNTSSSTKCLEKCATFPPSCKPKLSNERFCGRRKKHNKRTAAVSEANDFSKSVNQCPSRCNSLPTPSKLVSSLKGSREKEGIPPKKLSVSWAPDVYDPIPTSVSHVPNNSQHHRRDGKKHRKNKKKGVGKSDAATSKEKKKPRRKKRGSTSKCNPPHDEVGEVDSADAQSSFVDLNVASSDLFCGASFLKASSISNLHFPVAEAT